VATAHLSFPSFGDSIPLFGKTGGVLSPPPILFILLYGLSRRLNPWEDRDLVIASDVLAESDLRVLVNFPTASFSLYRFRFDISCSSVTFPIASISLSIFPLWSRSYPLLSLTSCKEFCFTARPPTPSVWAYLCVRSKDPGGQSTPPLHSGRRRATPPEATLLPLASVHLSCAPGLYT